METKPQYGLSCWPFGNSSECDNEIVGNSQQEVEVKAAQEGWCIGHWQGQGFYVCPEHANCVWDARRLSEGGM